MKISRNKFTSGLVLLIVAFTLTGAKTKNVEKKKNIVCITVPKSGTHLLYKCLNLLELKGIYHPAKEGVSQSQIDLIRRLNQKPPPYHYTGEFDTSRVGPVPAILVKQLKENKHARSYCTHWPYTRESENIFNYYGYANFFMIRDPRDQLISMAFMVHKSRSGKHADLEMAILDLIDGRQRKYIPWAVEIQSTHPLMWKLGVVGYYKLYLPWMKARTFYTVRFENLVGENGGGSKEAQQGEIRNIARHLGIKVSPSKLRTICKELFGGTLTFREGKTGSWKKYFTPAIKKVFKRTKGACQLLIDLGYEKDTNW